MTPSWYDVLDVEDDASTEEIRTAWRTSVADLDPTDRRFRSLNRAAEVLLDPERRAAHDATLAAERNAEDADTPDADTPEADAAEADATEADATEAGTDEPGTVEPGTGGTDAGGATPGGRLPETATLDPVEPTTTATATAPTTETAGSSRWRRRRSAAAVEAPTPTSSSRPRLVVLTAVLAVLAVLLVAATVTAGLRRPHSTEPDATDVAAAQAAAETAIVPVLSYDYRHLPTSEAAATSYMTSAYADTYRRYFAATVQNNAGPTKTVVSADVVDSGIVRTGPGRVDVLLFVNQPEVNKAGRRTEYNQVTARMVDDSGRWLVSCLITTLNGVCGQP